MKYQTGWWWDVEEQELDRFKELLTTHSAWNWTTTWPALADKITAINRVVDVGSGVAILDLAMHHVNTLTEFYLVDYDGISIKEPYEWYTTSTNYYNSWAVIDDLINSTPTANPTKFHKLTPMVDPWPTEVDLVISRQSWCYCYPKELYWAQAMTSLKQGGLLILDVLNLPDRNVVEEISNELNSEAMLLELHYPHPDNSYIDSNNILSNGSHGGYYAWVKNV